MSIERFQTVILFKINSPYHHSEFKPIIIQPNIKIISSSSSIRFKFIQLHQTHLHLHHFNHRTLSLCPSLSGGWFSKRSSAGLLRQKQWDQPTQSINSTGYRICDSQTSEPKLSPDPSSIRSSPESNKQEISPNGLTDMGGWAKKALLRVFAFTPIENNNRSIRHRCRGG